MFGRSLAIKCVSVNNQSCLVRPTLIDLNLELLYNTFIIRLNRHYGNCNTVQDPFGRICVPNKIMFNVIRGISESKGLAKHISCECRCEFEGRKCNSKQKWNNDKGQCDCKNQEDIADVKKTMSVILVNALASMIKILRPVNT